MQLFTSLVFAGVFTAVSCHVTVFRDGRWQAVPGRRPDIGGWDRFGFQSRPFGPFTDMWQFGFGFPGQYQSPWNNNYYGFPQILPAIDSTNPTQWINNGNGNQHNLVSDPWAQYRRLQANQLDQGTNNYQGTNNANSITDINSIYLNPTNPNVNNALNTFDTQSSNPGTGNQFPVIPNNAASDQFGQLPSNSDMFGSQFNSQFQGNLNNPVTDQFGQIQSNPSIFGSPLNGQFQGNSNNGPSYIGSSNSIGRRK